jgi:hypothetical protein
MAKLSVESVEFAKAHIEAYYDSDFFPKADEYSAIWANWAEVKAHLLAWNIEKLHVETPRLMPAPKHRGGYRVVHQLEPLTAITYTALAYMVARDVERARLPAVYSYRIDISATSFFATGNGYPAFVDRCRELATIYPCVLTTDIADFYNRLYLHRLNNAIKFANPKLGPVAKAIEEFVSRLNGKASQGVPIGPAASIVLSEATLTDVDQFIANRGVAHARYVDDIHIFANSRDELESLTEELAAYLFDAHRLQLSWAKHKILSSTEYVQTYLETPEVIERRELLGVAKVICDYGDTLSESDVDALRDKYMSPLSEDARLPSSASDPWRNIIALFRAQQAEERRAVRRAALEALLTSAVASPMLDIGLARHAFRRSRMLRAGELVEATLQHFEKLGPVLPDALMYLDAVASATVLAEHAALFDKAFASKSVERSRFVRHWVHWFQSLHPEVLRNVGARMAFWKNAAVEHQARAARKLRNLSWVRAQKSRFSSLGIWDRRSVLMATEVMPLDERRAWLNSITAGSSDIVERSIALWVAQRP